MIEVEFLERDRERMVDAFETKRDIVLVAVDFDGLVDQGATFAVGRL